MPIAWCELVDAMRAQRREWDGDRPWDPDGRFVPVDPPADEAGRAPATVEEALRSLPPYRPEPPG